jgi:hypothetical protein
MMHRAFGNWLLLLSALAALCVAVFEYFWHGNGIHGTGGALIVIVSTALVLAGAFVLGRLPERARGMRILLLVLLVVDILGTALAAYLLEAYALLALVVLARRARSRPRKRPRPARPTRRLPPRARNTPAGTPSTAI